MLLLRALCLLLTVGASAEQTTITSDVQFENAVLSGEHCWAVLFVSKHRDVAAATKLLEGLEEALPGLAIATADVDECKAVCSEFNVRKRMGTRKHVQLVPSPVHCASCLAADCHCSTSRFAVPRLLVFNSRARQAAIISKVDEMTLDSLVRAVSAELSENTKEDGRYVKLTLAIGGGEKDEV